MKAWIGINVISDNQGLLTAVENMMPHRLDNRLWDSDECIVQRSITPEGLDVVNASLFFNDFTDRLDFKIALNGINGFLHTALPDSFLKMSKSWHDEKLPNGCPKKQDELECSEVIV